MNDLVSVVYEMRQARHEDPRDAQPERDVHRHHDIKFNCSFRCLFYLLFFKVSKVELSFGF